MLYFNLQPLKEEWKKENPIINIFYIDFKMLSTWTWEESFVVKLVTKLLTPPNNEWKHIISYRLTSSRLSKCQQHTALDTSCYVIVANHLILLSCILVIACKRSHDCYTMPLFSEKSKRLKYASSPVHPMHPTYQQLLWCIFLFCSITRPNFKLWLPPANLKICSTSTWTVSGWFVSCGNWLVILLYCVSW